MKEIMVGTCEASVPPKQGDDPFVRVCEGNQREQAVLGLPWEK